MRSVTAAKRGEHGERVGPADHVEIEDLAAVLAEAEALGEEEEVELAPLGDLREVHERREVGLAARGRITPHGRVVHAREVRGEVDLLHDAYRLAGRSRPKRSRSVAPTGTSVVADQWRDLGGEPLERLDRVGLDEEAVDVGARGARRRARRVAAHDRSLHEDGRGAWERLGLDRRARRRRASTASARDGSSRASMKTSGWPCGDRGVIDGPRTLKMRPFEVDVVHLRTVEVPARRTITDDGVVLPAVPQPADDFDRVVGFGVQLVERLDALASEATRRLVAGRHRNAPAGAAAARRDRGVATFFETWNGSVCVVVTVATRPIDVVAGASRAMTRSASGRSGAGSKPSSRLTKSRPAPLGDPRQLDSAIGREERVCLRSPARCRGEADPSPPQSPKSRLKCSTFRPQRDGAASGSRRRRA